MYMTSTNSTNTTAANINGREISDLLSIINEHHPIHFLTGDRSYTYTLESAARSIALVVAHSEIEFTEGFRFDAPGVTLWVTRDADGAAMLNAWLGLDRDPGMASVAAVKIPNWVA